MLVRVLSVVSAVVVAVLFCSSEDGRIVTARAFVVEDDAGVVRARFGNLAGVTGKSDDDADFDDLYGLVMYDSLGVGRTSVVVVDDGVIVSLHGGAGSETGVVSVSVDHDGPHVMLSDGAEPSLAFETVRGSPQLLLFESLGGKQISLGFGGPEGGASDWCGVTIVDKNAGGTLSVGLGAGGDPRVLGNGKSLIGER